MTDIIMPHMTGTELVSAVKNEYPALPVVYISGEPLGEELHDPPTGQYSFKNRLGRRRLWGGSNCH